MSAGAYRVEFGHSLLFHEQPDSNCIAHPMAWLAELLCHILTLRSKHTGRQLIIHTSPKGATGGKTGIYTATACT
jgi:hypothetical protein